MRIRVVAIIVLRTIEPEIIHIHIRPVLRPVERRIGQVDGCGVVIGHRHPDIIARNIGIYTNIITVWRRRDSRGARGCGCARRSWRARGRRRDGWRARGSGGARNRRGSGWGGGIRGSQGLHWTSYWIASQLATVIEIDHNAKIIRNYTVQRAATTPVAIKIGLIDIGTTRVET